MQQRSSSSGKALKLKKANLPAGCVEQKAKNYS